MGGGERTIQPRSLAALRMTDYQAPQRGHDESCPYTERNARSGRGKPRPYRDEADAGDGLLFGGGQGEEVLRPFYWFLEAL
jgi:hypothetical protein